MGNKYILYKSDSADCIYLKLHYSVINLRYFLFSKASVELKAWLCPIHVVYISFRLHVHL